MCVVFLTEERLDIVEVFFSDLELRQMVQEELRFMPDFFRLGRKLQRNKATLQVGLWPGDCVLIYQAIE